MNPYSIVCFFEERIANWCGSKYGVAVESCTAAIFLSLQWRKKELGSIGQVLIPSKTYPSVPCSIIHCGGKVKFVDLKWAGEYELGNLRIWDSALRLKKDMYDERMKTLNGLQCLSFHIKKHLPIGRGGMILTDDENAYKWLKKARFDGRDAIPLKEDNFTMLGWNCYLEPANAARGIQLFEVMVQKNPNGLEDLDVEEQGYPDLKKFPVYQQ